MWVYSWLAPDQPRLGTLTTVIQRIPTSSSPLLAPLRGFYPDRRGGMPTSTWGSFCVKLSSACTRGRVGAPWAKKGRKSREVEKGQTPKFPRTPKDSHPGTSLSKERDSSLFLRSAYSPLSRPVPCVSVAEWCGDATGGTVFCGDIGRCASPTGRPLLLPSSNATRLGYFIRLSTTGTLCF